MKEHWADVSRNADIIIQEHTQWLTEGYNSKIQIWDTEVKGGTDDTSPERERKSPQRGQMSECVESKVRLRTCLKIHQLTWRSETWLQGCPPLLPAAAQRKSHRCGCWRKPWLCGRPQREWHPPQDWCGNSHQTCWLASTLWQRTGLGLVLYLTAAPEPKTRAKWVHIYLLYLSDPNTKFSDCFTITLLKNSSPRNSCCYPWKFAPCPSHCSLAGH